jgi:hypothetical protein
MSSNANANYTRIQAHGTASAFEPGFINQAATVGPPHGPVSVGSPYNVLEATFDLRGAVTNKVFPFGQIPPGCLITAVSFNSNDTLLVDNRFAFGFLSESGAFTSKVQSDPTADSGNPGMEPNGGQVVPASFVVRNPSVSGIPAIQLTNANPSTIVLPASVSVKVFYICP